MVELLTLLIFLIHKSLTMGAVTQANVGAGQLALASIGTKTPVDVPSRSQNFLGQFYQQLLANPDQIHALVGRTPGPGEVYEVLANSKTFIYGFVNQELIMSYFRYI